MREKERKATERERGREGLRERARQYNNLRLQENCDQVLRKMGNRLTGVLTPEEVVETLPFLSLDEVRFIFSEYAKISKLEKPLSLSKFLTLMKRLNTPGSSVSTEVFRAPELHHMFFFYADMNHEDRVDIGALCQVIGTFHSGNDEEKATLIFQSLDIDHDGQLQKSDFLKGLIRIFEFVRLRAHHSSKLLNRHGLSMSSSMSEKSLSKDPESWFLRWITRI